MAIPHRRTYTRMISSPRRIPLMISAFVAFSAVPLVRASVGVGAKAPAGAEMLFDGTAEMLHAKWIYWEGPRFGAKAPIKWPLVVDPVDKGTVLSTNDPAITAATV